MTIENEERPCYTVRRAMVSPTLDADWNAPEWKVAETLEVAHFHPESSDHHPRTQARMLYDDEALHGIFRVEDRYVRCLHLGYQSDVWRDACVEFFVKPKEEVGHFNFEMNCAAQLLCGYVQDATRFADGSFAKSLRIPEEQGRSVSVATTLQGPVDPEHAESLNWCLRYRIPLALLEVYTGPLGELSGQHWRANFNKCAENNSHPHWGTWSSIGEELNFHQPKRFGVITFE
jgi:hypothetical protein